jgi:DNA-binding XRE family transcriptional regulator
MARRKKIDVTILRNIRNEAGFTQKELASRIGISRETLSAIEREVPETINSLEAEVISAWYIACRQGVTPDTGVKLLSHLVKYFGFSEQNLIKMVKQLTGSDKQD